MQILALASVAAIIAITFLVNAHFATFRRWMEALFWAILGVSVMIFVVIVLLIKNPNLPNPFDRVAWYTWRMERAIARVQGGQRYGNDEEDDDDEVSKSEKRELVEKIQNYYWDKIKKLYDPD